MKAQTKQIFLGAALAFAITGFAGVAQSEPATNTKLKERVTTRTINDRDYAIASAHGLAACLYGRRPISVINHLDSFDAIKRKEAALGLSRPVECDNFLPTNETVRQESASVFPPVWRGMLAEAVIRSKGLLKPNAPLMPALAVVIEYKRDWFALTGRHADVDSMAVCVAESNPAIVVSLLRTKPQSTEEKAAVHAVVDALGPCLREGMTLSANGLSIRAALAEAYFHRALPSQEAASGNGVPTEAGK